MRWVVHLVLLWLLAAGAAQAGSVRIVKVLPVFLDQQGRQSLRPSLYERDAYQALLRGKPGMRSALRFDIQWKGSAPKDLTLRIEARGNHKGELQTALLNVPAKSRSWFGKWTSATLAGDAYKNFGELTAWRASLWSEGHQLAEQKSYLW